MKEFLFQLTVKSFILTKMKNNMSIEKILIDMDGVTANWIDTILNHPLCEKFDCGDQLNKHPTRQLIIQQIYSEYPNFFRDLPYIEEFTPIMQVIIESNIPYAWVTATGDVHNSPVAVGKQKQEWLQYHIVERFGLDNEQEFHLILPNDCKSKFANHETLLIDDFWYNIDKFSQAGGQTHQISEDGYFGEHEATLLLSKLMKGD